MKKMKHLFAFLGLAALCLTACKKELKTPEQQDGISQEVRDKVAGLGFNNENIIKDEAGYIVEGDIFLSYADLNASPDVIKLRVPQAEQYRTNNLVTGLPRNITVSVATNLPASYVTATNEAINRYNAENLSITFTRVSSGGNIVISRAPLLSLYLASAGFPTASGNPHNSIRVNQWMIGNNPGTNYLGTILAHELGHCVGFRHTDYMSREYSCGGSAYNEGDGGVGAIHIPGTPTGPDANSWMLACIGSGQNRPFNANDKTALNYLY